MTALDSFIRGAASILDLFGVLSETPEFLEVSDADAIRSDWEAIGMDIQTAIDAVAGSREGTCKRT